MKRMVARSYASIVVAACIVTAGCSDSISNVLGRVTVDGKPISGANIYFVPKSGPQAMAPVDENGNYRLVTPGQGAGVKPGTYRVFFAPAVSEAEEQAKMGLKEADMVAGKSLGAFVSPECAVPAKYQSMQTTDLACEVSPGSNYFNFDLDSQQ